MVKLMKTGSTVVATFSDGCTSIKENVSMDEFNQLASIINDEKQLREIFTPKIAEMRQEIETKQTLLQRVQESGVLELRGQAIICPNISEVSMPEDLAEQILNCEDRLRDDIHDEEANILFESYTNFWTLVCLNPDSRIRTNLFWFLKRNGMVISHNGLFVAYRNVDVKSLGNIDRNLMNAIGNAYVTIQGRLHDDADNYSLIQTTNEADEIDYRVVNNETINICSGETLIGIVSDLYNEMSTSECIYTDHHSGTFTIKLGQPVSMPRKDVDCNSDVTCSCGLHVASRDWLSQNYFGDCGLCVLVNPANVCALPMRDDYGKMRVCEYYPWGIVKFDEEGNVVDPGITDGFEDDHDVDYVEKIMENYTINNNDPNQFVVDIPSMPELNKPVITKRLLELATQCPKFRQYAEQESTEC